MDEAHCISQWGHDFRPSYLNLVHRFKGHGINSVRIALTATASQYVRDDICDELGLDPGAVDDGGDVFVESSNRPELNLIVRVAETETVRAESIIGDLKRLLEGNKRNDIPGSAIVFMPWTKKPQAQGPLDPTSPYVETFVRYIEPELGEKVAMYHSKMDEDSTASGAALDTSVDDADNEDSNPDFGDVANRRRVSEQRAFMNGERSIMVATKGFGMGIDKPNIRLVIHRSSPGSLEAYAQEAGRAGRDGEFANAILYRVRQPSGTVKSDRKIQEGFREGRYIREEDVRTLCGFLKEIASPNSDFVFFTNDEAMDWFARQSDFDWPRFPRHKQRETEFGEHTAILDRGYTYTYRTEHLERIINALHSTRPDVSGTRRVSLIDSYTTCGSVLIKPRVRDADAIIRSNHYFGEKLRMHGITSSELSSLLGHGAETHDVSVLVKRINESVQDIHRLLTDIKSAGEQLNRSTMLHFEKIVAPKRGSATGKDKLEEWLDYAGARKYDNRVGRFTWQNTTRSTGWGVKLGPAFRRLVSFDHFVREFMHLQTRREQNDREALERMLVDYCGEGRAGRPVCLRGILLGYLKSHEVIVGGNCHSCSRCVPDERFTASIGERRKSVVPLGQMLGDMIGYINDLEPETILRWRFLSDFVDAMDRESEKGRSVLEYITGWSGRVLDERPGHIGAAMVRLHAATSGRIEIAEDEVVRLCRRLSERLDASSVAGEERDALVDVIRQSDPRLGSRIEGHWVRAVVCRSRERFEEERAHIRKYLDAADSTVSPIAERRRAWERLRQIASMAEFRDQGDTDRACRALARLSDSVEEARGAYMRFVADWSSDDVLNEMCNTEVEARAHVVSGFLSAWLVTAARDRRMIRLYECLQLIEGYTVGKDVVRERLGDRAISEGFDMNDVVANLSRDECTPTVVGILTVMGKRAITAPTDMCQLLRGASGSVLNRVARGYVNCDRIPTAENFEIFVKSFHPDAWHDVDADTRETLRAMGALLGRKTPGRISVLDDVV